MDKVDINYDISGHGFSSFVDNSNTFPIQKAIKAKLGEWLQSKKRKWGPLVPWKHIQNNCSRTFGKSKGNIMSNPLGMAECMDRELLVLNSNLEMHYSTSPSLLSYSSFELCAAARYQ
jgi:hypothetical protein